MKYSATSKFIRISTRKVRLVADSVRGLPVTEAVQKLLRLPKRSAETMRTVILSAVANAKADNIKPEALVIEQIEVMGGPVMKRWHAVSKGSAHAFKKRMTHIKVVLNDIKEKQKVSFEKEERHKS